MKKKFILQVVAWLLTIAMLLPSAGAAITEVYAAESKAAYSGSVTFSDSSWWTEKEVSQTDLLGSIDPKDVSYIKFYSDTTFNIGYSGVNENWVIGEAQTSYNVSDIRWTDMLFKFGLSKNDGVMYTIKWDVYTGNAKPAEEKKDDTKGTEFAITTTSTDFGGTSKIPASAFKNCTDGAKIVVEFTQETADWWNLALHSDGTEWHNLSEYITNLKSNSYGYIDSFSAGDKTITVELSQKGVDKILADGGGLLFQVKSLKITKATVVPVTAKADPTATPTPTATPKPTATPTPTPIIQYTEGDVLTLTQDMVNKDGLATLKNGIYNKIVIPAGVDVSKVVLNRMYADLLVVEGGVERTVVLLEGEIGRATLENAKVEEVDYKKLAEGGMELEEALKCYSEYLKVADAAEKAVITFRTGMNAKIKTLETLGNASLDLRQGKVSELLVSTEFRNDNMSVSVNGHSGNLFVTMEKKQFVGNGNLKLVLNNCEMDDVVISGGAVSLGLDGLTASANTLVVENSGNVSLNMNADNLVVSEKTTATEIRVYGKIGTATVDGDRNSIILPNCGIIENAVVNGDKVRVYGLGVVHNAVVNGTGANVATYGTEVEGENDTTIPQGMIAMMPTAKPKPKATPIPAEGAAYVGSGKYKSDDWWCQYQMTKDELLGTVDASAVKYITFTAESNIKIGYNPVGDSDWETTDGGTSVTIKASSVEYFESFNLILTDNTGKDELVIWRVYTEGEVDEKPEEEYTAVLTGENEWTTASISKKKLLGDIAVENVESITFYSEHTFQVGYNYSATNSWIQFDDQTNKTVAIGDINWGSSYYVQVALWAASGSEYKIKWTVNLKSEGSGSGSEGGTTTPGGNEGGTTTPPTTDPDEEYVGDWGVAHSFTATDFAKYTGDVTITLTYRTVTTATKYQIKTFQKVSGWPAFTADDFAATDYTVNEQWQTMDLPSGRGSVKMTLKESVVKELVNNNTEVGIQVCGVIIESGELSGTLASEGSGSGSEGGTTPPTPTATPIPTVTPTPGGSTGTATGGALATPTPEPIAYGEVWKGSQESGNWGHAVQISADKFSGFKYDGTEKLVVTYCATDASAWGSQFKFVDGDWQTIKDSEYNVQISATSTTEVVTLSSEYEVLKNKGLIIQGYNWTISKVEVIGGVEEIWNGGATAIDWGTTTIAIDATSFTGFKFDGTEKMYITYTSTDTSEGYGQFKYVTKDDWSKVLMDYYTVGKVSIDVVEEVVLTSDFADAATLGFRIQGFNNTVKKVEFVK